MIYLVAIALIEQEGKRFIPIGGKSIKDSTTDQDILGSTAQTICLELLTRVLTKSNEAPICLANGENSLLLLQIPMEIMQENLPKIKSNWINTGDTCQLLSELKVSCKTIWTLNFRRYEGIKFDLLFSKSK